MCGGTGEEAFVTMILQDSNTSWPGDLGRGQGQLQGYATCPCAQKGPVLGLMFCCRHVGILNKIVPRGPTLWFCTGPCQLASSSWKRKPKLLLTPGTTVTIIIGDKYSVHPGNNTIILITSNIHERRILDKVFHLILPRTHFRDDKTEAYGYYW